MNCAITMFAVLVIVLSSLTLRAEETIHVVTENWAPFNFEENGVVKGTSTEVVKKVLDRTGLKYTIQVYPWARAYRMALTKPNVMIYTIVRMPKRENLFKWVRAITDSDTTYLYKLADRKDIVINKLNDAKKYQIGVIRESMYHQFLVKQGFEHLQIVAWSGQNSQKLIARRMDLWAEGEKNFNQELEKINETHPNVKIEKAFRLFTYPYYMAFSKNTSDVIVNQVKAAFDLLVEEGALQAYE